MKQVWASTDTDTETDRNAQTGKPVEAKLCESPKFSVNGARDGRERGQLKRGAGEQL